jgi:hypothetical protein
MVFCAKSNNAYSVELRSFLRETPYRACLPCCRRAARRFAPGNAGVIFYTDIIIPLVGFLLLWWQWRITTRTAAIT